MRPAVRKWWHGLKGGVIGGMATSGSAWLGLAGAKYVGLDVPQLNWKGLGIVLLSGGMSSAFAYLKQSPVPPDPDDVPITEGTITSKDVRVLCFFGLCAGMLLSGCAAMNSLIIHPLTVVYRQHEYNEEAEARAKARALTNQLNQTEYEK